MRVEGDHSVLGEISVMDVEPGLFWFGAWRNFNVFAWHETPTMDAVQRIDRTNPERTAAHPERISTAHIILPSVSAPSAQVRDAFNDMHQRWGATVGAAAVVIERGGLMGLAVRTTIAGMTMVAPKHYRVKVCETVDDAAPWLAEHHARATGVRVTVVDLLAVMRHARKSGRR